VCADETCDAVAAPPTCHAKFTLVAHLAPASSSFASAVPCRPRPCPHVTAIQVPVHLASSLLPTSPTFAGLRHKCASLNTCQTIVPCTMSFTPCSSVLTRAIIVGRKIPSYGYIWASSSPFFVCFPCPTFILDFAPLLLAVPFHLDPLPLVWTLRPLSHFDILFNCCFLSDYQTPFLHMTLHDVAGRTSLLSTLVLLFPTYHFPSA
jgi:hypothetical protein